MTGGIKLSKNKDVTLYPVRRKNLGAVMNKLNPNAPSLLETWNGQYKREHNNIKLRLLIGFLPVSPMRKLAHFPLQIILYVLGVGFFQVVETAKPQSFLMSERLFQTELFVKGSTPYY